MAYKIGLDIGGSTTKLVCLEDGKIIYKNVTIEDSPEKCFKSALDNLINDTDVNIENIGIINITGAGSSFIPDNYLGYKLNVVSEYEATGIGGTFLADIEEAIVVSMGTGTAYYKVSDNTVEHVIGTGVGGGTITGLGSLLLDKNSITEIDQMGVEGNTTKADLTIGDISNGDMPGLPVDLTAANFGRIKNDCEQIDIAAGMFNMVFQVMGTMMVLTTKVTGIDNIVAVGQVSTLNSCKKVLDDFVRFYGINIIIPEHSTYATAIGACIIGA